MLLGVSFLSKPLKFEVSLATYLGTLAWFAGWLPNGMTGSRGCRAFAIVVVACVTAEMIWLIGTAAYGTASHFNTQFRILRVIYRVMGVLAVILTSATIIYGVQIARNKASDLAPAFRLSLAAGLIATFVTTVLVAGFMAGGSGHFVGRSGSDAGGLPNMGWSRDGGDLRVPHFFAAHAMQFVPAVGYVIARGQPGSLARAAVFLASATCVSLIAYTFIETLQGKPFLG